MTLLICYTNEFQRHDGILLYQWLLERARTLGLPGGSAFRGVAGFGEHRVLHEEHFFELASNVPVKVEFMAETADIEKFTTYLMEQNVTVFYVKIPATGVQLIDGA